MKARSAMPRCVLPIAGILGLVLASTIFSSSAIIAQETAPSEQAPAKQSSSDDLPPLPLSPVEKAQKDGTALMLSLKDVTKLALVNNLDIAIQNTSEDLSKLKLAAAKGNYDPTLSGNLSLTANKQANTSSYQASSGSFSTTKNLSWDYSFKKNFPFTGRLGGSSFSANWSNRRSTSDQTSSIYNPSYSSQASVSFTQPLLRNRLIDSTRGNILLTNLDLDTTESQFKQKVTDTISNIQSQYWDLVSAIRDYEIKRRSVKLGQITLRDNKKKVEVGTLAPIGITEAQADLAQRELSLISSEENILRQENSLRQLISNDRKSDIWSKVIVPTETPDFKEYPVETQTAIQTALTNRPELEQIDIQLKQLDINRKVTENSRKWQADFTAKYGSNGDAGQPTASALSNPSIKLAESHVGGLPTTYKNLFSEGLTNWSIAIAVNVPLKNTSIESQLAQQGINRHRTEMQRKSQEQAIQVEIKNAVQKLDTNKKQIETAKMSRQLSEEQLSAEDKRYQAGLSENFRVLDRQNQLAQAEFTYLTNLINYKKSILALQKGMYTLLESSDFSIAKGSSSNVPALK
jgi:outer membrane protein